MADWGSDDEVISSPYKKESNLSTLVSFSPDEQADVQRQESNPQNDIELDQEIKKAKDPKILATLQGEKQRRASMTSFGHDDDPVSTNFGHDDEAIGEKFTPGADVVGGLAAGIDTLLPVSSAIGGIHALGTLASGQGLDSATKAIEHDSQYNLGAVLQKYYPEAYERYKQGQIPAEKLGQLATYVGEHAAQLPLIGSPALGAAANVVTQAIPFILGERALSATVKVPKGIKGGPDETASKTASDMLGENTKPVNPEEPIIVDPEGQAMRPDQVDAANAARQQRNAAAEAERQANGLQPLERDPNKPIYVDSDGNAMQGDQLQAFTQAKAEYEAAKNSSVEPPHELSEEARQGDLLEPPEHWYIDENGMPVKDSEQGTAGPQSDLFNPQQADVRPTGDLPKKEIYPTDLNPIDYASDGIARSILKGDQRGVGERPTRQNYNYEGGIDFPREGPALGLQLDGLIAAAKRGASPEALKAALEGKQGSLFEDSNMAEVQKQADIEAANRQREVQQRREASPETRTETPLEPSQGSRTVLKIQRPISNRGFGKYQRGTGDIFNDLARGIFKVGDMIKDVTGRLGRVIGEDANGYRLRTEVEGGIIYSTLRKQSRDMRLGDDVRVSDGRTGTVRAVTPTSVKVSIPRDGGFDLESFPPDKVDLMDRSTRRIGDIYNKQAGHGEMFKDLAELIAKGAAGLRDMYLKRPDQDNYKLVFKPQEIKDITRQALTDSNTLGSFRDRMEMAGLPDDVLNRVAELWNDKEAVLERIGPSRFSQLDAASRKQVDDTNRPYNTMMSENGHTLENRPTQDTGHTNRILNVSNVQKLINSNKDVGPILNWVISNTNKIIGDGVHLFKQLAPHLEAYKALRSNEKAHLTQVAIDFDGLENNVLRDAGLQWASEDMLRAKGLNDRQIKAYQDITTALDIAWKKVQQTFLDRGQEAPAQIPGYFPHYWHGSYKVLAYDKVSGTLVKMKASATGWESLWHRRALEKEGFRTEMVAPESKPTTHGILSTLVDSLNLNSAKSSLDKAFIDRIRRADEYAKRGIITELIERKANIGGHLADQGVKSLTAFNFKHNARLVNAFNKYLEDVSQFYANTRIASEVAKPFMDDALKGMYDKVPTFKDTVNEYLQRATGHPVNHFAIIDTIARAAAKGVKMPPNGVNSFFKAGAQLLYYTKLSAGNVLYAGSQILQPIVSARNLWRVHTERSVRGAQTGNVMTAWGNGLKELLSLEQGQGSAETMAVMKYFRDKGLVDSRQIDMIDPSNTAKKIIDYASLGLSPALEHLEVHNRTAQALMYYHYFKDAGLSQLEASRAAVTQMGLGMGEYAAHHSAGMFTDTGLVGHQLRPFGLLPNTYLGEAYMNVQIIGDAVKAAKAGKVAPTAILNSMTPLALMSVNMVLFAGMAGMVGFNDYNQIVKLHNYFFPDTPWLDAGAKLREMGVSTPYIYGILGNLIPGKPNIGPSINMPGLSDIGRFAGVDAMITTGKLVGSLISRLSGNAISVEDFSSNLRRLAPGWTGEAVGEWVAKHINGNVPNSTPSFTKNTVKRDSTQSLTARITGKPNIDEQSARDANALNDKMTRQDQEWKAKQVHMLTDIVEGMQPGIDLNATLKKILAAKRGVGDEIIDAVLSEHEKRMVDTNTRQKLTIAGADGARMARLKQIYDMLHGK